MAKKSLQYTPLGPFMTMSGAIFVDRGNSAHAVRSLADAGETMTKLKISLMMFPEGTRTSSEISDMLPLKKGGFHLAIQAGIPIIPVVTENYWRLYHKGVFGEGSIKTRGKHSDFSRERKDRTDSVLPLSITLNKFYLQFLQSA
jgi:lysophosphatidate acyltransferase